MRSGGCDLNWNVDILLDNLKLLNLGSTRHRHMVQHEPAVVLKRSKT